METKFELKLAITRLICEISPRFLRGVGLLNDVSQILPRPTLVAIATKYGSKLVITQVVWCISPISLRLTGGFWGPLKQQKSSGNSIWGYAWASLQADSIVDNH